MANRGVKPDGDRSKKYSCRNGNFRTLILAWFLILTDLGGMVAAVHAATDPGLALIVKVVVAVVAVGNGLWIGAVGDRINGKIKVGIDGDGVTVAMRERGELLRLGTSQIRSVHPVSDVPWRWHERGVFRLGRLLELSRLRRPANKRSQFLWDLVAPRSGSAILAVHRLFAEANIVMILNTAEDGTDGEGIVTVEDARGGVPQRVRCVSLCVADRDGFLDRCARLGIAVHHQGFPADLWRELTADPDERHQAMVRLAGTGSAVVALLSIIGFRFLAAAS